MVMGVAVRDTNSWAALYFITLLGFGQYLLVNIFVAIMVEGFATDLEAVQRFKEALLQARTVIRSRSIMSAALSQRNSDASSRRSSISAWAPSLDASNPTLAIPLAPIRGGALEAAADAGSDGTTEPMAESAPASAPETTAPAALESQDPPTRPMAAWAAQPAAQAAPSRARRRTRPPPPPPPPTIWQQVLDRCLGRRRHNAVQPSGQQTDKHFPPAVPLLPGLSKALEHAAVRGIMALVLVGNVAVLACERASIRRDSAERRALDLAAAALTACFTVELIAKCLAYGAWQGPQAVLRSNWNRMEALLVVLSWIDVVLALAGPRPLLARVVHVFRLFRALQPLRIVHRLQMLRKTVETLFLSVRPISNVFLIGAVFYFIFAVFGVQLFKGAFHSCQNWDLDSVNGSVSGANNYSSFSALEVAPDTQQSCLAANGTWENQKYNFDNLIQVL